jgi:hypothetical protein
MVVMLASTIQFTNTHPRHPTTNPPDTPCKPEHRQGQWLGVNSGYG